MPQSIQDAALPGPSRLSISRDTQSTLPASYRPTHRPHPIFTIQRVDIHAIKQELHDALGEDGLPYWKALNGYLLGQLRREELGVMVTGWFKGKKLTLHNRLLLSLLHNASSPPSPHSHSPTTVRKRKRGGVDDLDFDADDTTIEPKARVQQWMMGISGRERARMRRAVIERATEEDANGEEEAEWGGAKDKWSSFTPNITLPPLALSARQLPSSHQFSHRLSQYAKADDLSLSPDAMNDIGEFMAVGVDAHLGDLLHGIIHFTGRERPGSDTIRVPKSIKRKPEDGMVIDGDEPPIKQDEGDLPRPDLETLQSLFTIAAGLHPQASPALYKLATSLTLAEAEYNSPIKVERQPSKPPPEPTGVRKAEAVATKLLENGLLKIDKAGKQSEGGEAEGKKDRKHNLHWKYEDPALILRDVLG